GCVWILAVNHAGGALLTVSAVMVDPGLTQDLLTEAARPFFAAPIVFGIGTLLVVIVSKRMRAGAQSNDGFAAAQIIHEMLHLLIGQLAKSQRHDAQVG